MYWKVTKAKTIEILCIQVLAAKAEDVECALPEISPSLSNLINNTTYTGRWTEAEQQQFSQLFKLEKNEKLSKESTSNEYKDR